MSKVKYRCREYTPKPGQNGTHSFFAEVVINTDIDAVELAKKIAARTGIKSYEAQMAIHAIADIVAEETLEGSRVSLANEDGTKLVSIYPKVQGSISDAQVQAQPEKYNGATVATEEMLTPDLLTWSLGATMGVKYSQQFALNKSAQKVKMTAADITTDEPETPSGGDNNGGGDNGGSGGFDTGS